MATTSPSNIWIPDSNTPMVLDTMFANLASSLENGIGARVKKLESFVGAFMRNNTVKPLSSLGALYTLETLSTGGGGFSTGVGVSGGAITIEVPGIYTISASTSAQRTASGTTLGLLTGFVHVNGAVRSSGYVHTNQAIPYEATANCALTASLVAGDVVTLGGRATGYAMEVLTGSTTTLGISLVSRA